MPLQVDFLHREIISRENIEVITPFLQPYWDDIKALLIAGKIEGIFNYDSLDVTFNYIQASMSYPYHFNISGDGDQNFELSDAFIDELIKLVMKGVLKDEL